MASLLHRTLKGWLGSRYYRFFPADHRNTIGGLWDVIGQLQFDFLVQQGLQSHHVLLDVGCGSLRGGQHYIRYLNAGQYVGVDLDQDLLDAGQVEITQQGLAAQQPRLVQMSDFNFPRLARTFDYAIAQSVFSHLDLNNIIRCLRRMEQVLAPGGAFFATFFEVPSGSDPLQPITHPNTHDAPITTFSDRDPYHYDFSTFEWICRGTTLHADNIGDWKHPRNQHMIRFTKSSAS